MSRKHFLVAHLCTGRERACPRILQVSTVTDGAPGCTCYSCGKARRTERVVNARDTVLLRCELKCFFLHWVGFDIQHVYSVVQQIAFVAADKLVVFWNVKGTFELQDSHRCVCAVQHAREDCEKGVHLRVTPAMFMDSSHVLATGK